MPRKLLARLEGVLPWFHRAAMSFGRTSLLLGMISPQWDLADLYTTGEVTLVAVPEPATIGLLLAGLGLGYRSRWQPFGVRRL